MLQRQALDVLFGFIIQRSKPAKCLIRVLAQALAKILSKIKRFDVPSELSSTYCQMLLGTYEAERVSVCKKFLRPGMTAVDVGAHVGYYTCLFTRLVGSSGKVYAFEPHPKNFEILTRNVQRFNNVFPIQSAVLDREADVVLYEASVGSGAHSLINSGDHHGGQIAVKGIALDGFLKNTKVDLIKIDVEGYEVDVLHGAKALIQNSGTLAVIVEVHRSELASRGVAPRKLQEIFTELGFELYLIEETTDALIPLTSWERSEEVFTNSRRNYFSLYCTKGALIQASR